MNSVLDKINRLANEPHQMKTKNTFEQTQTRDSRLNANPHTENLWGGYSQKSRSVQEIQRNRDVKLTKAVTKSRFWLDQAKARDHINVKKNLKTHEKTEIKNSVDQARYYKKEDTLNKTQSFSGRGVDLKTFMRTAFLLNPALDEHKSLLLGRDQEHLANELLKDGFDQLQDPTHHTTSQQVNFNFQMGEFKSISFSTSVGQSVTSGFRGNNQASKTGLWKLIKRQCREKNVLMKEFFPKSQALDTSTHKNEFLTQFLASTMQTPIQNHRLPLGMLTWFLTHKQLYSQERFDPFLPVQHIGLQVGFLQMQMQRREDCYKASNFFQLHDVLASQVLNTNYTGQSVPLTQEAVQTVTGLGLEWHAPVAQEQREEAQILEDWCRQSDDIFSVFFEYEHHQGGNLFIVKNNEKFGDFFVTSDVNRIIQCMQTDNQFVQKYIENPFLVNERKFDIKVFTLLVSAHPLVVQHQNDYYYRFCPKAYSHEDLADLDSYMSNVFKLSNGHANSNGNIMQEEMFSKQLNDSSVYGVVKSKVREILTLCHAAATPKLQQKSTTVELLEWDFILDEKMNVFVLGCSRCPDLQSCEPLTQQLLKDVSILLNDSDFQKFVSGECLGQVQPHGSKLEVLVNEWAQVNRKHVEEGKYKNKFRGEQTSEISGDAQVDK